MSTKHDKSKDPAKLAAVRPKDKANKLNNSIDNKPRAKKTHLDNKPRGAYHHADRNSSHSVDKKLFPVDNKWCSTDNNPSCQDKELPTVKWAGNLPTKAGSQAQEAV
jgi:hypothetical protein